MNAETAAAFLSTLVNACAVPFKGDRFQVHHAGLVRECTPADMIAVVEGLRRLRGDARYELLADALQTWRGPFEGVSYYAVAT